MLRERLARSSGMLSFVKRLFSGQPVSGLPEGVLEQLAGAPLAMQKFPNQGRGLVASKDIQQGEVLLSEQPFVCCPALGNRKKVCYHCLKVLPSAQQQVAASSTEGPISTRNHAFCSQSCLSRAQGSYYTLESQVGMQELDHYCSVYGERFPLMAARLALMIAQDGMLPGLAEQQQQQQQGPRSAAGRCSNDMARASKLSSSSNTTSSSSRWSSNLGTTSNRSASSSLHTNSLQTSSWRSNASSRSRNMQPRRRTDSMLSTQCSAGPGSAVYQEVIRALGFLCFANIPPPPPAPWPEVHKMIIKSLKAAAANREDEQEAAGLAAAVGLLDLDWYVAVMARLHINTFKVDCVMDIDWIQGHAAMSAMLGGDTASAGSALYLLASLFNHSCEPNVLVTFPNNDSTVVFTAARHIAAGEQLFISYIDAEQDVDARQEYLAFAYGFRCRCVKCQEDLAEAAKHMPPQLP